MMTRQALAAVMGCALILGFGLSTAQAQEGPGGSEAQLERDLTAAEEEFHQSEVDELADEMTREEMDRIFVEGHGGYGFQFGETQYLPDGPNDSRHPLVNGWTAGATAGIFVHPQIALVAGYEYSKMRSVDGQAEPVLDNVEGRIDYHTVIGGLRLYVPVGPGAFRAQVGVGAVMPYEKKLVFDYGSQLEQVGITGKGRRIEHFNAGPGVAGQIGYELHLGDSPFYLAGDFKLQTFESNNKGRRTELRNFVTDFEEVPPQAVTTDIRHRKSGGDERPSTDSVQEVTLQLGLGARF
ncbi:MAG: outer membrane protein [Polyangiales bacterium]